MTHTFEENVFLGLMVALVVGIAAMLMFSDRQGVQRQVPSRARTSRVERQILGVPEMTQDDAIKLARENGLYEDNLLFVLRHDELTLFANAIEAKYRERLLSGAVEPRMFVSYEGVQTAYYTADQLAAAVLREREECAKVCEAEGVDTGTENELETDWWLATRNCAQAIRARGNKA